jgi:hypothetical protein
MGPKSYSPAPAGGLACAAMTRLIIVLAVLLAPSVASAQSSPNAFLPTHQMLPWGLRFPITNGNFIRDVWVSPYTVVLDTIYPVPTEPDAVAASTGSEPATSEPPAAGAPQYGVWRQSTVVPGYWVRQTTAGDFYPQRWMLEQLAPGNYRWRLLPAEMRPR